MTMARTGHRLESLENRQLPRHTDFSQDAPVLIRFGHRQSRITRVGATVGVSNRCRRYAHRYGKSREIWISIAVVTLLGFGFGNLVRAECPPVAGGNFDVLMQRDNVRDVLLEKMDLEIQFDFEAKDDRNRPVMGQIKVLAYSTPKIPAREVANPKLWARFSYGDNKLGRRRKDDHLSILANRLGGHHFGWLNVVVGGNTGGAVRPDGTIIHPQFVDPQAGGYGDRLPPPEIYAQENDALAADLSPWYFNHGDCDLSLYTGDLPTFAAQDRRDFTFNESGTYSEEIAEFWFEDRPGLLVDGDIEYRTWLMLLNADNSLHSTYPGFSWLYDRDSSRIVGYEEQLTVAGPLDPISTNAFTTYTQNQGFASGAPPLDSPVNGDFIQPGDEGDGAFGWTTNGAGSSMIVEDSNASDSFANQLTAGSPVTISQVISTPNDPFFLLTSALFESTDGSLFVQLDGQPLATIDGFASADEMYTTVPIAVSDGTLFGREALLEITYDGPTGSWARLDNIVYSAEPKVVNPEPTVTVIVSPIAISEKGLGSEFGTPLTSLIDQSGFVDPFISGETSFNDFVEDDSRNLATARTGQFTWNFWSSPLLSTGEPADAELVLDFGQQQTFTGLALWNGTFQDVEVCVSDAPDGPCEDVESFLLEPKTGLESAVRPDVLTFQQDHVGRYVRLAVKSLYRPDENSAWIAVANEIAASVVLAGEGLLGDFNGNGGLDVSDVDLLTAHIREAGSDEMFDVNFDGGVDQTDLDAWIHDLKNTYFGDANLNGEFDSADLVAVFAAGEYEDGIGRNSTWEEGDFNGDGDFDSGDLVKAFIDGGYAQGPRVAAKAVPEPTTLLLLVTGVIGIAIGRRHDRPGEARFRADMVRPARLLSSTHPSPDWTHSIVDN